MRVFVSLHSFFFNDPATSESDPYVHTLSLPVALPIAPTPPPGITRAGPEPCASARRSSPSSARSTRACCGGSASGGRRSPSSCISTACRSEEHTSELQSLMRSSYAVFCLKKKKHTRQNTYQTCTKRSHDTIQKH